jgi:hypothetical protein
LKLEIVPNTHKIEALELLRILATDASVLKDIENYNTELILLTLLKESESLDFVIEAVLKAFVMIHASSLNLTNQDAIDNNPYGKPIIEVGRVF